MTQKVRIDVLLVQKGLFPSREKAQAAIMAGDVTINQQPVEKSGQKVSISTHDITVRAQDPYVSRGGLKLAKAIKVFNLDLKDRCVLDIGASTGGFTDCALQNGAAHVYAVDVGYGQLAWKLRQSSRVTVLERTNIRYLKSSVFKYGIPDFVTTDVSFISLGLIYPKINDLLQQFDAVFLVKPQFEAGRALVGKKGVVKDPAVHQMVLQKVVHMIQDHGGGILGINFSPITGPKGNIEYLLYLQKPAPVPLVDHKDSITNVVQAAHSMLGQSG